MRGEEVRVVDVPADAGKGLGIFKTLPDGTENSAVFVQQLSEATSNFHGTAQPAFLK